MATNPITANQIIDAEGVIKALTDVESHLVSLKEALKIKAKDIKITVNNGGDMTSFLSQVNAITDAMGRLKEFSSVNTEMLKAFTDAQKAAASATRKRVDTNNEYYDSLRKIDKEERELDKIREATINKEKLLNGEITTSALSYNQLSAVYSNMSSVLKNMSKAEIEASEDMRKFAAVTKQVRDGMNEAQKAMGNYSLNVGKYHTAFDGLGYSIQQVMREVPSAINVQQFFLAISNNIPMVVDQLGEFKKQQEDIKSKLNDMKEGTKEYIDLQKQQMSVGKKVLTSIMSWQSLILVALVLLRKYGDAVVNTIKNAFTKISDAERATKALRDVTEGAASQVGSLMAKYTALKKEWEELSDSNRLKWVKNHKDSLKELGITINSISDAEDVFVNNTDKVIDSMIKRARSAAAMTLIQEKYAEYFKKLAKVEEGARETAEMNNPFDMKDVNAMMGDSPANRLMQKGILKATGADTSNLEWVGNTFVQKGMTKEGWRNAYVESAISNAKTSDKELVELQKDIEQYKKFIDVEINAAINDGGGLSSTSMQDMNDRYWEAEEAKIKLMKDGYDKEIALSNLNNDKMLEANEMAFDDQITALINNRNAKLITQEEYDEKEKIYIKQRDDIEKGLEAEHQRDLYNIWEKYEKIKIEGQIRDSKVTLDQTRKRIKTRTEEAQNNKIIIKNIESLEKQLSDLRAIDTKNIVEEEQKKQEEINKTIALIEKQRSMLSWSKQLKNYKGLGDLMGAEGVLEGLAGGDKAEFLSALGLDMSGASPDQVDSVFDEWMNNASEAMVKWKDITIDSLGQILDAYVDFYQARADAAAEDTDKAKEAYELQKSLLEQGYANSVSTAWAEYQEKQALQKKAEEDAKNAEKVQKAADSASTASNLIVASSNILKQFAANPILAGILLSTMWGSFAAAKVMAFKASKYEEGGYEELTGGSHASGHDINLGVMNGKGRSMVAEGGESIGIFSRKAKRKYGSQTIADIVNSINNGTYEKTTTDRLNDNVAISVKPYRSASVNLTRIENTLDSIDRNGKSSSYVDGNGNRVVTNGNAKTTYIKR